LDYIFCANGTEHLECTNPDATEFHGPSGFSYGHTEESHRSVPASGSSPACTSILSLYYYYNIRLAPGSFKGDASYLKYETNNQDLSSI
jgi:hypothetical protein